MGCVVSDPDGEKARQRGTQEMGWPGQGKGPKHYKRERLPLSPPRHCFPLAIPLFLVELNVAHILSVWLGICRLGTNRD